MNRTIAILTLLVIVSMPVMACVAPQAGPPEAAPAANSSSEKKPITFWDTMNGQAFDNMQKIVDACTEEVGNVEVTHELIPFAEARNKFIATAQAGNAPDVIRGAADWSLEFAARDYLLDITDKVTDKDDYLLAVFAYNDMKGKIWGIPQAIYAPALLYNKSFFEEQGLNPETPPTNLDEFVDAAKILTKDDHYGFMLTDGAYYFQPFMYAFGGSLLDRETFDITVDNPETINALNFVLELRDQHKVMPETYDLNNQYVNATTAFKEGNVAMIFNGPWATVDILSGPAFADNPENLGIALTPEGPGGQGSPINGYNYAIYKGTKYPDEAYQFIACLNKPKNQAQLATAFNLLPSRKSTYELPEIRDNRIIQGFFAQVQITPNEPIISQSELFYTGFSSAYNNVLLGVELPEEAMSKLVNTWRDELLGLWCWDWGVEWCCQ